MDTDRNEILARPEPWMNQANEQGSRPSISLVLPAYNEQEVIQQAIREADEGLAGLTDDYEILVVDDGSTDDTRLVAERESRARPAVRVIALAENAGYGAALRTGFQAATKQLVGYTDADCQFDVREMGRLMMLLRSCDIACGYRIDRQDHWLRLLYSRVYNFLVRLTLGTGVRDIDCAFKLFRRETLESVLHETDGFLVNAEMLTKARLEGRSVIEVGVTHRARADGQSTVSVLHSIPVIQALVRFCWSTVLFPARSDSPPQLATSWSSKRVAFGVASLCLLSILMFLGNLSYPLIEPDESRYTQIALEMVESSDYVVPRLGGEPYLDKPPLLYWTTAASFNWFGANEVSARLPTAVAAWLTVLATFLLGRRLVGDRTAYIGGLMLFLCLGFVLAARFLIMDGLLALFTTISILAAFLAIRDTRIGIGWWITSAAACGLGIMTKGPIAAVLTLPPLIAAQWLAPRMSRLNFRHWLLFTSIVLLITAPWFVLIGHQQADFAKYFFWKHHVLRFVSAFNHQEPFWYYLPAIFIGMFPASLLVAPVFVFLTSRAEQLRRFRTPQLGFILLAAIWIVAFFSMSSCKLPTYILPALPLLCLVQASMVSLVLNTECSELPLPNVMRRIPTHATTIALVTGGVIAGIDLLLEPDRGFGQLLNISMIAIAGLALVYRVFHRQQRPVQLAANIVNLFTTTSDQRDRARSAQAVARLGKQSNRPASQADWVLAITVSLLVMIFGFQKFMPELAHFRSINAKAAELHVVTNHEGLPVVYFDHPRDGASFHFAPGQIHHFAAAELGEFRHFLQQHPKVVVVTEPWQAKDLQTSLATVVELTPTRGARGRVFVATSRTGPLLGAGATDSIRR